MYDDGTTIEVTRVCTDGTANACSLLYGAMWRAAKALGYLRLSPTAPGRERGLTAGRRLAASEGTAPP